MSSKRRFILSLTVCLGLFCTARPGARAQDQSGQAGALHDVVVRGGRVMDPESGLDGIRHIAITEGSIRSVTIEPVKGRTVLDATGFVVAPGFIDSDGFPGNASLQVRDGVTTVFDIREGTSDVARWYADHDGKLPINFGVGVGYTRVRSDVMGETLRARGTGQTTPSEAQIAEILRRVERGFDAGAVALGMVLSGEADPTGWEHVEALRIAAGVHAHVVTILRDENWASGSNIAAYLARMIGAAALSGATIHIPHVVSSAGPHTPRLLEMMARARARALEVTAETAPYLVGATRISAQAPMRTSSSSTQAGSSTAPPSRSRCPRRASATSWSTALSSSETARFSTA